MEKLMDTLIKNGKISRGGNLMDAVRNATDIESMFNIMEEQHSELLSSSVIREDVIENVQGALFKLNYEREDLTQEIKFSTDAFQTSLTISNTNNKTEERETLKLLIKDNKLILQKGNLWPKNNSKDFSYFHENIEYFYSKDKDQGQISKTSYSEDLLYTEKDNFKPWNYSGEPSASETRVIFSGTKEISYDRKSYYDDPEKKVFGKTLSDPRNMEQMTNCDFSRALYCKENVMDYNKIVSRTQKSRHGDDVLTIIKDFRTGIETAGVTTTTDDSILRYTQGNHTKMLPKKELDNARNLFPNDDIKAIQHLKQVSVGAIEGVTTKTGGTI